MGAKITIRNKELSVNVKESVWDIIEIIKDITTDPTCPNFISLTQDKSFHDMGNIAVVGEKFIVNINDIILIRNN
jgi:hypothetical protein